VAASVYSRALQKAAELAGGREKLSKILQVPRAEIDKWIADQAKPPRETFLRIVDLILDATSASGDAGDSQEPPPSRDAAGASSYLD
jgi:hypothetical protein